MSSRSRNWVFLLVIGISIGGLFWGWRTFWFLTDDAFIAFRYVSNSVLGHGYVWNAPPFLPIEGYTSFLWVLLLDFVWRVLGIEPPAAANWMSLVFAAGTIGLTAVLAIRLRLSAAMEKWRVFWLSCVLLGCLTNRTFLAWSSSGLETAMFNFWILAWFTWIILAPRDSHDSRGFVPTLSLLAVLIYLTRPDGLLYVVASLVMSIGVLAPRIRDERTWYRAALLLLPFLILPAHLLWRRSTYGAWLPNTYMAKYTGAWLESGVRYAFSFLFEYALWVWIIVVLWYLAVVTAARLRRSREDKELPSDRTPSFDARVGWRPILLRLTSQRDGQVLLAGLTVASHAAYYTVFVGGDHFEYRVYSHLIPLIVVGALALLNALEWRPRTAAVIFTAWVLLSLPVPWTHWARSQEFTTREETYVMIIPVADSFPPMFRPFVSPFDDAQEWLIRRHVCMRHQEHKTFHLYQAEAYPPRSEGAQTGPEDYPVAWVGTVGVPSWTLPHVNFIDTFGLNDYVVARNPIRPGPERLMAHSRRCPPRYLKSYDPNLSVTRQQTVVVRPREIPLTAERIASLEVKWRLWIEEKRDFVAKHGWEAWDSEAKQQEDD